MANRPVLVMASANPDKVAEIAQILTGCEILPRPRDLPDVIEDGATLLDNARLKSEAVVRATGQPAVADDTGLEVDAFDGRPGVHTARFAGPNASHDDNIDLLLSSLATAKVRTARFRTVAIVSYPDGGEIVAEGVVEGTIAAERRGIDGWGYDPVFEPVESGGRTFAEMAEGEKNAISHRGRAFTALQAKLDAREG